MRAAVLVRPVQWLIVVATAIAGMALLLGASSSSAQAPARLTLTGAEEVPAVTSATTGSFSWTATSTSLSYELIANGAALTMAHIHQGAKGANGPVVAFLFGPDTVGVNAIHVSGTVAAANLIGPLAGNMAGFQAALKAGNLYVNVHSVSNPAGIVRSQIPASATPAAPSTGTGGVTGIDNMPGTTTLLGVLLVGVAASTAAFTMRRRSIAR